MKKIAFAIFAVLCMGFFTSCDVLLTTTFLNTAKFGVAIGWNGEQNKISKGSSVDNIKYIYIPTSSAKSLSISQKLVQWITVDIDGQWNEWERGDDSVWTPNDPELSLGTHTLSVWEDGRLVYNEEFTLEIGMNIRFIIVPGGSLSGGIEWEDTIRPTLVSWGYGDGTVGLDFSEAMDESLINPINYQVSTNGGEIVNATEITGITFVSFNEYQTVIISGIPSEYNYLIIGYIDGDKVYTLRDKAGNFFSADDEGVSQKIMIAE